MGGDVAIACGQCDGAGLFLKDGCLSPPDKIKITLWDGANNHLSSDIQFPLNLDIPSIGMGPKGGGLYGDKEWVDKHEFYHSIDILLEFILKWDSL